MFAMLVPGCSEYLEEPFLYRKPFHATLADLECQPDECAGCATISGKQAGMTND